MDKSDESQEYYHSYLEYLFFFLSHLSPLSVDLDRPRASITSTAICSVVLYADELWTYVCPNSIFLTVDSKTNFWQILEDSFSAWRGVFKEIKVTHR